MALLAVSVGPAHARANVSTPVFAGLECAGHGQEVGETGMCTHGADPVPDFIRERGGPRPHSTLTPRVSATASVGCDGNGTSGKRVQAIYAYVSGRPNRRSSWVASFRVWASNVDEMFRSSAAETGGSRRLRWVTNNCRLAVPAVAVRSDAETSFGALIGELSALGYDRSDRKYLVWIDSDRSRTASCGVATVWPDDRPTGNANNERATYARVDHVCWDFAEQHEMMHALGAVQGSAPNATRGLHCTDEYDQMCYADGQGVVVRNVCPVRYERLFDCNHDDYFSTSPRAGSYLATHWNTANSGWLVGSSAAPPPPGNDGFVTAAVLSGVSGTVRGTTLSATQESGEPAAMAVSAPVDSVWYSWTAPDDGTLLVNTCDSHLDTTMGLWTGTAVGSLSLVAANDDDATGDCGTASRLEAAVTAGSSYAVSVDGRGGAEGPFSLGWTLVPAGADLDLPSVSAPAATLVAPQLLSSRLMARVTWTAGEDESGITSYELQRRRGTGEWSAVTLSSPTALGADVSVATGTFYSFRLRATDGAGNTSAWASTTLGKIVTLQETAADIVYSGAFKRAQLDGASGGYVRHSAVAGRVVTLSFTGRAAGFVTTLGPGRGMVDVRLDGGEWQQVDLYAAASRPRRIVWAVATEDVAHTLQVRVSGTRNPASSSARVDVDAFVVWR